MSIYYCEKPDKIPKMHKFKGSREKKIPFPSGNVFEAKSIKPLFVLPLSDLPDGKENTLSFCKQHK